MGIDNRTEINNAEGPTTEWGGSDVGALETGSPGLYYQGTASQAAQFSDTAPEYTIAVQDSNGTAFSIDLSDSTIWVLIKDNLVDTEANDGMQVVLGDGEGGANPIVGYTVGGNDNPGVSLGKQFTCIRLDASNISGLGTTQHNGTGAPTFNAIAVVGYGANHIAPARGSIDNIWIDRITYINNKNYALTANGGSSGTPLTMDTLVSDDVNPNNGWGVFTKGVGSSFTIFASTEFGDSTASTDSYFQQSDSQIFLDGQQHGANNFIFRTIGNSGGTNSFVIDNCLIVGTGEPAIWDFTDNNFNILKITGTQFVDNGWIDFPVASAGNRFVNGSSFIGCNQLNFSTIAADDVTIKNSSGSTLGGIILDTNGQTTNQTNFTFESGGTGHGVYITAPGTYDLSNWNFSGYSTANPGDNLVSSSGSTDAMVYNNSGGAVQLNLSGGIGENITIRNGASATTTVVVTINITITNIVTGSEVRMYDFTGGVVGNEEFGGNTNAFLESITGTSVTFTKVPQKDYLIKIVNPEYVILRVEIPSTGDDVTQKITQVIDRVFSNP